MRGDFVSYLRVSTERQGRSGLGLEAQRQAVTAYLNGGRWRIIAEHVEVESGRNAERPALDAALAEARLHRVPLVVAKVDRLTRSVAFLSKLLDSGVEVRFCDLPQVEGPAGRFMLNQMVAVAELEAGLISARTKAALAAAKARGKSLGGDRGVRLTDEARAAGTAHRAAKATDRARDLAPTIASLREAGITSASGIAKALNERGIPTARGGGEWQATQVQRVLARLDA
jgi:DNA invertase Pin-like site-specific DNA recombinase